MREEKGWNEVREKKRAGRERVRERGGELSGLALLVLGFGARGGSMAAADERCS